MSSSFRLLSLLFSRCWLCLSPSGFDFKPFFLSFSFLYILLLLDDNIFLYLHCCLLILRMCIIFLTHFTSLSSFASNSKYFSIFNFSFYVYILFSRHIISHHQHISFISIFCLLKGGEWFYLTYSLSCLLFLYSLSILHAFNFTFWTLPLCHFYPLCNMEDEEREEVFVCGKCLSISLSPVMDCGSVELHAVSSPSVFTRLVSAFHCFLLLHISVSLFYLPLSFCAPLSTSG